MAQGLAVDAHVQQGRYHESHAEIFVQMHDGARIEVEQDQPPVRMSTTDVMRRAMLTICL